MEEIQQLLKKNRPNLSESSIITYTSMMKNLMKKMDKDIKFILKNPSKVIEFLKDKNQHTRKSMLAMLVSLTDDDRFREEMMKDAAEMKDQLEKQERTDKQKENWMDWSEVVDHYNMMYKRTFPLLKKEKLNTKEMDEMVDLLLLSFYVLIPPRRSQDYANLKARNFDDKVDNYVSKGKLYFNKYKTQKFYGKQDVPMPPKLKTLISKWMTKHDNDYVLFDKAGKPLTNVKITNRLNRIFGKKISSSMLRHIYLSFKFKDAPTLLEMKDLAEDMGHSISEQGTYIKHK
jgi:integrase